MSDDDRLCLFLCSGLAPTARIFRGAGWRVVTVDVDPRFEPTVCADVRDLMRDKELMEQRPRVVLASPPCERLSKADDWPIPGIYDGLSTAGACLEIVARMRPRYWCLENPGTGYLRWFIGEPTKRIRLDAFGYRTVKPTGLWGNIPLGLIDDPPGSNPKGVTFANRTRDPAKRAAWPDGLSSKLLEGVSE